MGSSNYLGGTYLDASAVDLVLTSGASGLPKPLIVSEYTVAEKMVLPWDDLCWTLGKLSELGVQFVRTSPVSDLLVRPQQAIEAALESLDPEALKAGRRRAVEVLERIKAEVHSELATQLDALRAPYLEWIELVKAQRRAPPGDGTRLFDPRKVAGAQSATRTFLEASGIPAPNAWSPPTIRMKWHFNAWKLSMMAHRLKRTRDRVKDLRNDPIDAVHYALGATYCDVVATGDRHMKLIYELVPKPRGLLRYLA